MCESKSINYCLKRSGKWFRGQDYMNIKVTYQNSFRVNRQVSHKFRKFIEKNQSKGQGDGTKLQDKTAKRLWVEFQRGCQSIFANKGYSPALLVKTLPVAQPPELEKLVGCPVVCRSRSWSSFILLGMICSLQHRRVLSKMKRFVRVINRIIQSHRSLTVLVMAI